MYFNVVVVNCGNEESVAHISAESIPNKGDELEIVMYNNKPQKYKVTGVERKYVCGVNANWSTFITVRTVRYD